MTAPANELRDPVMSECLAAIAAAHRIVIASHPKPDGDAIGSALGLKHILLQAGKDAVATGLEPVPRRYTSFVPDGAVLSPAEALTQPPDLIIALDAGSVDRIPEELQKLRGVVRMLNIDHHISNAGFGDTNWIDVGACSTGEMVLELIQQGDFVLDRAAATWLWIAIVTDTGRFAYSNTSARAMRAAAELLPFGLDTEEIDRRIYRQLSHSELELRKRAIESLQFALGDRVAYASLRESDFVAAGCTSAETEDIVEIPRCIENVDVALLFYEGEKVDRINVSARASGACDVSELCCSFGGGGHTKAAGCRIKGDLAHAQRVVLEALATRLPEGGRPAS
jgi:phosphoesterase RecJ-like protein